MKWVIYVRKSSEDANKQVRSLKDQIKVCQELAKREGYNVVEVFQEIKSAKKSGNRPEFNRMLDGLRQNKYQGILSWAPDRLSRNMKEAGEIIDMLDNEIILDLDFAAHAFVNDYNGLMTLGISFVISKQYSDRLAHNISRGNKQKLKEGKHLGRYVHGYIADDVTQHYQIDERIAENGKTFYELIKEGFQMRLKGNSLATITEYINDNGYYRETKQSKTIQKMTQGKLSNMFKDPIYYGEIHTYEEPIDLVEIHGFLPMITKEEYEMLQDYKPTGISSHTHNWPFIELVKCGDCDCNMRAGKSTSGTGQKYLYYWCENKECGDKRKKQGKTKFPTIRAKVVIEALQGALADLNLDKAIYKNYGTQYAEEVHKYKTNIATQKRAARRALNNFEKKKEELEFKKIRDGHSWSKSEQARYNKEIKFYNKKINTLTRNIDDLEKSMPKEVDLKSFLNSLNMASTRFPRYDLETMDSLAKNVFLNLVVKDGKVASISYKEPFASMPKTSKSRLGAPERT